MVFTILNYLLFNIFILLFPFKGGMMRIKGKNEFLVVNCSFEDNDSFLDGGLIYFDYSYSSFSFYSSKFLSNKALFGNGGVFFLSFSNNISFYE
jgi:hypothetical protein